MEPARMLPIFALGAALALHAQVPAEEPTSGCLVEGQVVAAGTAQPLKKARVGLRPAQDRGDSYGGVTDAAGRFSLQGVKPGRYRLWANRNGYVTQQYGQRAADRPGTILTLAPGQKLRDIVFRLARAAVLAGRLYDEDAEPIPWVGVEALRYRYLRGTRQLAAAAFAMTNDLGEFRLFGLAPGTYYVRATVDPNRSFASVGSTRVPGTGENYAPTYYPGTNDEAHATPIQVRAGDELAGLNFSVSSTLTVRVSGRVYNATTGEPAIGAMVFLLKQGGIPSFANLRRQSAQSPEGRFTIDGVAPGSYVLTAFLTERNSRFMARMPLEVSTSDIETLRIVIHRGFALPGRVRIEGPVAQVAPTEPQELPSAQKAVASFLASLSVSLRPQQVDIISGATGSVEADGTFVLENVGAGDFRVGVASRRDPLPEDFYIKSARLGGTNVLDEGLSVAGGALAGSLEIVLSTNGGRVDGTVLNADEEAFAGATVVLAPGEKHRQRTELFKTTTTDQYGRFSLRGIAPGSYRLYAWEQIESGAYQDSDFRRRYEKQGQAVTVAEGDRRTMQLKLIEEAGGNP